MIGKGSLTEIKSLKSPPADVKLVGDAICMIFGGDVEPSWNNFKKIIADANNFLKRVKGYNMDKIHPKLIPKLAKITSKE